MMVQKPFRSMFFTFSTLRFLLGFLCNVFVFEHCEHQRIRITQPFNFESLKDAITDCGSRRLNATLNSEQEK